MKVYVVIDGLEVHVPARLIVVNDGLGHQGPENENENGLEDGCDQSFLEVGVQVDRQ